MLLQCVYNTALHIYCYTLNAFKMIYFSPFILGLKLDV